MPDDASMKEHTGNTITGLMRFRTAEAVHNDEIKKTRETISAARSNPNGRQGAPVA